MFRKFIAAIIFIVANAITAPAFCGDLPAPPDTSPQALWSTPGDGTLVMLVRSDAFYDASKPALPAIPLRVRVCVTNMTGSNNSANLYVWTTQGPQPNPNNNVSYAPPVNQPQTIHMQLGDCVEIDRPGGIVVQELDRERHVQRVLPVIRGDHAAVGRADLDHEAWT